MGFPISLRKVVPFVNIFFNYCNACFTTMAWRLEYLGVQTFSGSLKNSIAYKGVNQAPK